MSYSEQQYAIGEILRGVNKQFAAHAIVPNGMERIGVKTSSGQVELTFTAPDDITIGGVTVASIAEIELWRQANHRIDSYGDGELLETFTGNDITAYENTPYVDSDVSNDTRYFYRFFIGTDTGAWNTSVDDQVEAMPPYNIYGFKQTFSDKNPSSTITYPDGVVNASYTPMHTNEGTGTATAGSWGSFLTDFLKNKPFMVGTNGQAAYPLNPNDYTKKMDGSASDYNNTSYAGGAFAWLNKVYVKEVYDGASRTVYFSNGKIDDDFYPIGFVDKNGSELEGVWIPMGYTDASGKVLVAGTSPCNSKNTSQEKELVDGFSGQAAFLGGPIMNVIRDLMYMMYKSTDIQTKGGHGRCAGYSSSGTTLAANAVVPNGAVPGFKGTSDKNTLNKAFHSQVLFSYQVWLRDPYTLLINGKLKVSPHYVYDLTGDSYATPDDNCNWTSANGGWNYPASMGHMGTELGSMPKHENKASTSTGLCDGVVGAVSGVRVGLRVGVCSDDLIVGPAALRLNDEAGVANWSIGFGTLLLPSAGYAPQAS